MIPHASFRLKLHESFSTLSRFPFSRSCFLTPLNCCNRSTREITIDVYLVGLLYHKGKQLPMLHFLI
ncbi:hypothetical protein ANTRET_LOCUS5498 [Anthophora retusa]